MILDLTDVCDEGSLHASSLLELASHSFQFNAVALHMLFPILSFAVGASNVAADEGGLLTIRVDTHPLDLLGVAALELFWLVDLEPAQHGLEVGVVVTDFCSVHK